MYQFSTPISALAQGAMTAPMNNSFAVAMRQLAEAAKTAQA